jgi:hypothetical protein
VANDGLTGFEAWIGRTAIVLDQPERALQDLEEEVHSLHLAKGMETSLTAKLNAAREGLSMGETTEAILAVEDFMTFLDVKSPKKIPEAAAADLTGFAQDLVNLLDGVFL